jgi:hypothetical protein
MITTATPRPPQFVQLSDGTLYDAQRNRDIRPGNAYAWHFRKIRTGRQLRACLRAGDHAWPGGYALYYLTSDGAALCPTCVRNELRSVTDSIRNKIDDGWRVTNLVSAAELVEPDTCDHCSETID